MVICQTRPFGFNYVDRRELSKVLRHDWIILFEKIEVVVVVGRWVLWRGKCGE